MFVGGGAPAARFNLRTMTEEDLDRLQGELSETRQKLKAVTSKFAGARKERDTLKKENKEL